VWLVQGDDPTLVSEAVRGLVEELVGDLDRALTVEDFRGDEVDLGVVADACQTPPFLSDRRVVVVRDIGRFSTEDVAPLLAYLDDPSPTTALVLVGGDGRIAPKLAAAVKAKGHIVGTQVGGREVRGWIRDRLRQAPVRVDAAAEALIEAHLGEDFGRLSALLAVLTAAYGDGARLGPDEVEPYLGQAGSVTPWDFTDAIDAGETEVALTLLHRLLEAGERHPLVVLATLHRHIQGLLRVDHPTIRTEAAAAQAMGIAPGRSTYPAKKALASAQRYRSPALAEAIGLVADAELALKGARDWPGELVLEVLVARLCRLARRGAPGRRSAPAARSGSRR
jgi:DNA polymerase-3 subunit delta